MLDQKYETCILYCDECGKKYVNDKGISVFGPISDAMDSAKKDGWGVIRVRMGDDIFAHWHDFCPKCLPEYRQQNK